MTKSDNIYGVFDGSWALLTAGTEEKYNTMTISWGGMGTLWGKRVATVYVRPNRYTYEFMENNDYFTISFYPEEYKKDLTILGTKSGRDCDKVALTELKAKSVENSMTFEQATLTLVCKKLYWQDMDEEKIPKEAMERFFATEPVHRMYIGEVVEIL
ncbi:MAG: flavin reductase [Lachnospiraceae bacterium]|nr:flavin reductase [Lachnospiraceae bacterium]